MPAAMPDRDISGSQSVDRALGLLTLIAARKRHGYQLSELVVETGLNKATIRRLLMALMRFGFVEQDPVSRRYFLGPESYVVGTLADERFGIQRLASSSLRRLADRSEDPAFLSVRRGNYALCLYREEGRLQGHADTRQPGIRNVLGVGAGGLVLLAALGDAEVDAILETNAQILRIRHPHLTPDLLRGLVAETRQRGYALNRGMVNASTWGIAVAVHDVNGEPDAALSISTSETRLKPARQEMLAELLREEACILEAELRNGHMSLHGQLGSSPPIKLARNASHIRA